MQTSRRGFLKALTKVAVAVAAAPAVVKLEVLMPVPVEMLDQAQAIGRLRGFDELLAEYFGDLLYEECMKENWLLTRLKAGPDWDGGSVMVPIVFGGSDED